MAKIYTKVGDKGQTSLVGGQKVAKTDPRLEAYGTIDELNSVLGFVRSELNSLLKNKTSAAHFDVGQVDGLSKIEADLEKIQHWLFDLGSLLAAVPGDREKYKLPHMSAEQIQLLETQIDSATALLTPLKEFILPGGSEASSRLHIARTVARRAERAMVALAADLPENAVPFVNRLSDYLFVMARYCNYLLKVEDTVWKAGK
ncbi:MAG: cob(I)yrinic acid a,c-diamide adenosyltransferase [Bdellovibrionota bacterium]